MHLDSRYRVKKEIKIRREKFGGIIYDHKEGMLQFIHSHLVFRFLENDGKRTVREMAEFIAPGKMTDISLSAVLKHLNQFQERAIIDEL